MLDGVSRLCGRTHVWLQQVAERLDEAGLSDWAKAARRLAREHAEVAVDCNEDTQPTLVDMRKRQG